MTDEHLLDKITEVVNSRVDYDRYLIRELIREQRQIGWRRRFTGRKARALSAGAGGRG